MLFTHSTFSFPLLHLPHPLSSDPTTEVTPDFVSSTLLRPALFTRAIYCGESNVTKWDCEPCRALGPDIHVIKWGGGEVQTCLHSGVIVFILLINLPSFLLDNAAVPNYIVAHDNSTNTIVVAHRGTNTKNLLSILTDLEIKHVDLDKSIFKNPNGVTVHVGFQDTFKHTSSIILTEVKKALIEYQSQSVLITGHSQGAAIATLGAVMLHEQLDSSVKKSVVVFGLPRMGNEHWANYVDSTIGSEFHRVTDRKDPVVDLPPHLLNFFHPSGEIHIEEVDENGQATKVAACPGQENKHCSAGNSIFHDEWLNHRGRFMNFQSYCGQIFTILTL
ncbi:alpha/beta-hydrolase [Lentinula detonsa]|uniref:Alpha/beta-hydrolase n=1 Tax=Lentinula detonsa TaxID=2804962 RepID=A0A9W8NVK9_9AGAR|nr:alpha/beta-hydrolase [Lentinula detonsa]